MSAVLGSFGVNCSVCGTVQSSAPAAALPPCTPTGTDAFQDAVSAVSSTPASSTAAPSPALPVPAASPPRFFRLSLSWMLLCREDRATAAMSVRSTWPVVYAQHASPSTTSTHQLSTHQHSAAYTSTVQHASAQPEIVECSARQSVLCNASCTNPMHTAGGSTPSHSITPSVHQYMYTYNLSREPHSSNDAGNWTARPFSPASYSCST